MYRLIKKTGVRVCVWFTQTCSRNANQDLKWEQPLTVWELDWVSNPVITPSSVLTWRYLDEDARWLQKLQVPNAHHLLHADHVNFYCCSRMNSACHTARSAVSDPSEGNRYRHTCSWFETNEFECLVAVCMPTGVGSSVSFELPRLQSSRTLMPSAAASAGSANCWRWRICSLFPDCVTRHHLLKMRPLRALCREKRKDLINRGSKL